MLDSVHAPNQNFQNPRPRRRRPFRLWLALLMLVLLSIGILIGSRVVSLAQKILEKSTTPLTFGDFFISADKPLLGETEGEVRVLLLGIGGAGHEGGTLADTIILATLKPPSRTGEELKIGLVSIPRDLVVSIPGYEYRKINTAYAFGGTALAIAAVEGLIGQEIPYYAVIDFAGFEKIIDDLDGVVVDVPVTFTDARFPDSRFGYLPPLTFEQGRQVMDGERALQYVRSRHGNNNQGSDFARAKRQQQVIQAIWDEVRGLNLIANLGLVNLLLNDLADHFRTNFEIFELKRLYDLVKTINPAQVTTTTISGENGLVCDQITEEDGAYILIPCEGLGKYQAIRKHIRNQSSLIPAPQEQATVEIQNASGIDLLSSRTRNYLSNSNLQISTSNFTGQAIYQESVIYDNTAGQKPATLEYLRKQLGLRVASSPFPFPTVSPKPDFVIIVTADLGDRVP